MKKFLAGFMALVLILTSPAYASFGYADTGEVEPGRASILDSGEMKVKGTNSFGTMLADSLAAEMDEQESNAGYNVFSIEMKGKEASVSFEALQDAALVVGIYDEDGIAMLGSGKSEVSAGDTETVVSIDIDAMPQYFYLRGFLVDEDTLRPLCTAYESPNYTKEMQEFFTKTTDNFDADRVLNLDADKTNNFAVYSDKVTVVSGSGITVESIDEENNTYVFKNADSIAAMQQGDTFSYECADGTALIVKVGSIRVDGDTVTVTGMDTSMEDVFEYVKIDTSSGLSDITVDDSKCDEGVTYNGIVYDSDQEAHLNAFEADKELGGSLSFDVKKEDKTETSGDEEKKGIYGNVNLKISGSVKAYISLSYQYMEVKLNYSAKANLRISMTEEKKLALGFIGISPLPGLFLEFTPSFVVKVSASVSINASLWGTIGFRAEIGKGIENISTSPQLDVELKGEISVFVGLSLEPKIKIVSDHLAKASLDATLGAEAKGTLKHTIMTTANASTSKIHECKNCIDGDISAKAELKFSTKLLNSDKFSFGLSKSINIKICDWYFSIDFGEFGLTSCPHYLYKTTITVEDYKKNLVRGAEVNVPFIIFEKDENGNEKKTKIESAKTNDDGKVEGYLASGKYNVSVTAANYNKTVQKVTITDDAKSDRILMWERINESGDNKGEDSEGEDNKNDEFKIPSEDEEIAVIQEKAQSLLLLRDVSSVLTENGSLYRWGSNYLGQLGDGTTIDQTLPVKVLDNVKSVLPYSFGDRDMLVLTKDGELYVYSYNVTKILDNVASVLKGNSTYGAITEDGSLYMWGSNSYGQVGNGTVIQQTDPVKVLDDVVSVTINSTTGAITKDGSLYMWGLNDHGQVGSGTTGKQLTPVKILDNMKSVVVAYADGSQNGYTAAISEDDSLYMWGNNFHGQIGNDTYADQLLPVKILDDVESVKIVNDNINNGCAYVGAILKNDDLYMWGGNFCGQLGNGTNKSNIIPKLVLKNVKSIYTYYSLVGAILTDGSLYIWGGTGKILSGWGNDGSSYGTGLTKTPKKVSDIGHVKTFASDGRIHQIVTENGDLYMWGSNTYGEIGNGKGGKDEKQDSPIKILENVELSIAGYNTYGAITKKGSIYMWGKNSYGQVGDGTKIDRNIPKKIFGINLNKSTISDEKAISLRETEDLLTNETIGNEDRQTAVFRNLMPNSIYNFYIMKSRSKYNLLNTANLLYILQTLTDADGKLCVTYMQNELFIGADVFVIGAGQYDVSSSTVNIPNLEYSGKIQYIKPMVVYQGRELTEWDDYELLGDYSATDVGDYIVTIHGIGEYKGSVNASYKITEAKSRKVEKITLSAADATLNAGNTLQLIAEVFPEDAENKTLQWSSSDEQVATVDGNGKVTAIGAGQATITVKSLDGSGASASCVITVTKLADNSTGGSSSGGSSGGSTGSSSSGGSSGGSTGGSSGGTSGSNPNGGSISNDPDSGNNGELQVKLLYYIVEFSANGGNSLSRKTMTLLMNDTLGILPKIQRKQYDFKGWYTQKSGGEKVTQATVLNASTTLYAQWAKTAKSVKPAKLSLKAKKGRQMKVSYKKVSGASGYQIAYSTNKKFASSATKKITTSSTSKILKNLKKGKTYYVRVRAYQTDSAGNKVYGTYSGKKSIKIKA